MKLVTITITQCKTMDLPIFHIPVVPGRKICFRCYTQLSGILKDPRDMDKVSKSFSPTIFNSLIKTIGFDICTRLT